MMSDTGSRSHYINDLLSTTHIYLGRTPVKQAALDCGEGIYIAHSRGTLNPISAAEIYCYKNSSRAIHF